VSVQAITWALAAEVRSATHKAVLLVLANYADDRGMCWPAQSTLAREACCSARTVRRVLDDLEEDAFIARHARRRRDGAQSSDHYVLALGAAQAAQAEGGTEPKTPSKERAKEQGAKLTSGQIDQRSDCPTRPAAILTGGQIDQRSDCPGAPVKLAALVRPPMGGSLEPTIEPLPAAAAAAREPAAERCADWRGAVEACFAAAGPGLAERTKTASLATSAARIEVWLRAGCDLEADIVPVIAAQTAKPRARPVQSWGVFEPDVLAARDRRLAPLRRHPDPSLTDLSSQEPAHDRAYAPTAKPIGLAAHVADAAAVRRRGALRALHELGELADGPTPANGSDVVSPRG
jgi:hypothetical protein